MLGQHNSHYRERASGFKRPDSRGPLGTIPKLIVAHDLKVNYRWHQEPVLKGVNGTFNGKSLVLGPNGSGKTTLFRAICGLTNITSGDIAIDGRNIDSIFASTGVLSTNFQEVYTLLQLKSYDVIRLYTDLSGGDASSAFDLLSDLGLGLEALRKQRIEELSAGQVKMVCTAVALAMKAKHVLLDEPFEQLDPARKGRMIRYLDSYDGVILVNTHETWLLRNLQEWSVFFMFEGVLHGPISVKQLLDAELSFSDEPEALLRMSYSGGLVSFVRARGRGTLLTSLENLDKIYELAGVK